MDQMEMMMMLEMQKLPEYSISPPPPPLFHIPNVDSFSSGIEFQDPYNNKFETSRNSIITNPLLERRGSSMGAMREMIFRMAAMQPVQIDPETVKAPKRRNVKISKDPQSVAARHRRERISEKIRILQRIVPGGTKMDTASMLDEAIHYVKFLKKQVHCLEKANVNIPGPGFGFPATAMGGMNYASSLGKGCQSGQMLGSSMQMLI